MYSPDSCWHAAATRNRYRAMTKPLTKAGIACYIGLGWTQCRHQPEPTSTAIPRAKFTYTCCVVLQTCPLDQSLFGKVRRRLQDVALSLSGLSFTCSGYRYRSIHWRPGTALNIERAVTRHTLHAVSVSSAHNLALTRRTCCRAAWPARHSTSPHPFGTLLC